MSNNFDIKGFDNCVMKGNMKIKGLKIVAISGESQRSQSNVAKLDIASNTNLEDTEFEDITIIGHEVHPIPTPVSIDKNHLEPLSRKVSEVTVEADKVNKAYNYMDKFKFIKLIGSGGFGTVYQVIDKNDQQNYVIKKVPINDNYLREVRMLSMAKSERVVEYTTSWIQKDNNGLDCLYIQMAFYDKNFRDYFEVKDQLFDRSKGSESVLMQYLVSCQLFKQIVESVNFLHNRDIIHRDLKPENIMLDLKTKSGNFIRLCDFGLAKLHDQHLSNTKCQGTFKYMAPEVACSSHYDRRCDVYSLGVIGQELFDFDINEMDIKLIEAKLSMVKKLIVLMSGDANDRPSCDRILDESIEWTIDVNMIEGIGTEIPVPDDIDTQYLVLLDYYFNKVRQ